MKKRTLLILLISSVGLSQNQQEFTRALDNLQKATFFYQNSQNDTAYYYAKQSFDVFNSLKNDSLIKKSIFRLITVTTDNDLRNNRIDQALRIAEETRDSQFLADIYYATGRYHFNEREYPLAIPLFLKVDSISRRYDFVDENVVWAVLDRSEISRRTFTHDGVELAHKLQNEALELAEKISSETLIYETYLRLADMYGLLGNQDKFKYYLDLVLPYYKKNDDVQNMTRVYLNFMNYYYYIDDYKKAGETLEEGIAYLRTKNDSLRLARLIGMYGTYYRKRLKNYKKAIEQLQEAKSIYVKLDNKLSYDYMYLLEDLAICAAEIKDYENAYEYYKETYEVKKELVKKANNEISRKLESKYQGQRKEQEIALLKSKNELSEQQKVNQRNLLLGGLSLSALIGLILFILYRNRQKSNIKLKELDTAKSSFFANISHEFRTPLTLIQAPIDDELIKNDLQPEQKEKFNLIKRNSKRLLSLVDQLLMLSKIESKTLRLQVSETDIEKLIKAIASSFSYGFKENQIDFQSNINVSGKGYVDGDFLEKILTNLLSNALKYTPKQGLVKLEANVSNNCLILQISNSGRGIGAEHLKKVFDKFYQINSNEQGYGIGLALIKQLTEAHKGKVDVMSINNERTMFKIMLPISKKVYRASEIVQSRVIAKPIVNTPEEERTIAPGVDNHKDQREDKPKLLLVEDNNDMRRFITGLFINQFHVISAINGEIGIKKAFQNSPDIIISDIMMPKVDGLELTRTLKNDQRTSHIPIILLTAKAGQQNEIMGIKTGADDYLVKPFNRTILLAKVETLLNNRAKTRAHYNHEVVLKPAIFSFNKTEEKFFSKLQNIINEKLQDPSFHVNDFSAFMGMSRMQLHRKLKATLGVTASEFLRTERLKAAKKLLENSQLSISEIAYTSGFNDANYFSKRFKKLFKIAPKEYKNRV